MLSLTYIVQCAEYLLVHYFLLLILTCWMVDEVIQPDLNKNCLTKHSQVSFIYLEAFTILFSDFVV